MTAPTPPWVVRGAATEEEIAAVVAALLAGMAAAWRVGAAPAPEPASAWRDPALRLGVTAPRRGGWRYSALPR